MRVARAATREANKESTEKLICVNCEQPYDPARNPKWACEYHPGCYGIAGPIKRGYALLLFC